MAQMIVSNHGKTPLGEIGGQGFVAQNVFRDAVREFHDGPDGDRRNPRRCVDGGFPICGEEGKFLFLHGKRHLLMLYSLI